jgi:S1-C subfamily serine protease
MRDNDSGSEEQSAWQPPEYVSPWAAGSSAAQADDTEPAGYGQPAGSYSQPTESYSQPAGSYGQPEINYGQHGDSYGQSAGGGYGTWSGGSGQDPWGFGYGTPPPPPRQGSGLRRFLVYATVAMLAAGAGAGAAIELNHSPASAPAAGSGGLPENGNGGGNGNGNGGIFGGGPFGGSGPGTGTGGGAGRTNTGSGPLNATALAAKVDPAVVDVNSTLAYSSESAAGTGMVISSDGFILTNNHVIDQATNIMVTEVATGQTYPARVVGYDLTDDVAVLQVQKSAGGTVSGLKTITLGDSDTVKLGDPVLAIGNAGGRGGLPSTAQGIINAKGRNIQASDSGNNPENLHGLLQTNAPIQEGDSGGPLVNAAGAVIGIDTAANTSGDGSQQQQQQTAGFAIPINNALAIAREIMGGQASTTVHIGEGGFIGINAAPAGQCPNSPGLGTQGGSSSSGAFVCQVYQNTPAAAAGLVQGDVITAVNGTAISSATALTNYLEGKHPGDKLTITFTDPNGSSRSTTVTLGQLAR